MTREAMDKVVALLEALVAEEEQPLYDYPTTTAKGVLAAAERLRNNTSSGSALFDQVLSITNGQRQEFYGHPLDNHGRCAALWSVYLGRTITAEDVCWMMILLKVGRQVHVPAPDNLVDVVGYARNIEMIEREREHRGA